MVSICLKRNMVTITAMDDMESMDDMELEIWKIWCLRKLWKFGNYHNSKYGNKNDNSIKR